MYNLQTKFNTFYQTKVVLPKDKKDALFNKKNINVERLKEGLKEYNEENGTDYKLSETPIVQGSVAMSTVVQNEDNDYDIDVAIVFEKSNLPGGTIATKNIIVNALKRKCTGFKTPPEAKTNCVRIVYKENYHIDFAIYRRYVDENGDYKYEHCGSEWRERDPRSITKWFLEQNKEKNYNLREIVRLMKMFSKSRTGWVNMPAGLIQSVLADEKYQAFDRIDERFYHTMVAIRDRLADDKEVYNPTDATKSLKLVNSDSVKMDNLYNRLNDKLGKLDILFESDCTYNQAIEAWEGFFNHSYWTDQKQEELAQLAKSYTQLNEQQILYNFRETEEYIQTLFPVNLRYVVNLDCKVKKNDRIIGWLNAMRMQHKPLLPGHNLYFYAETNVPEPFQVYWKIKNRGPVALEQDCIRGQIERTDKLIHSEPTSFRGDHYVECYVIKSGECVAKARIDVPIKV
ncbi:nucleotidyltransferase [Paenibacillus sp. F411]|uniref:nucleotide-binding domain-containing protein n=1 Tax=Paenibacillus sp. F411 TaxID=2820239 RepID=UPI001AAFB41A|nr:nucleotidyltransferase [Paenibacillus sp. F411]MBO2945652.1 nucleotidyltransferase [Paenibacillus sp. F411]